MSQLDCLPAQHVFNRDNKCYLLASDIVNNFFLVFSSASGEQKKYIMKGLVSRGLVSSIKEAVLAGKPLLGICLGMQLFFDESEEKGHHQGLGLLRGKVKVFDQPGIKIPQIGWNQLKVLRFTPLMKDIQQGSYVYFNHGYYCQPDSKSEILTTTEYGFMFASSVQRENIFGVQFHPEKSQNVGLKIIQNFVEL